MTRKKTIGDTCPICDRMYEQEVKYKFSNVKTRHHIFPKLWYKSGLVVYACSECHTYGFHKMFPMRNRIWTPSECVQNWVKFCKSKGKDAYVIYPELTEIEPLY